MLEVVYIFNNNQRRNGTITCDKSCTIILTFLWQKLYYSWLFFDNLVIIKFNFTKCPINIFLALIHIVFIKRIWIQLWRVNSGGWIDVQSYPRHWKFHPKCVSNAAWEAHLLQMNQFCLVNLQSITLAQLPEEREKEYQIIEREKCSFC